MAGLQHSFSIVASNAFAQRRMGDCDNFWIVVLACLILGAVFCVHHVFMKRFLLLSSLQPLLIPFLLTRIFLTRWKASVATTPTMIPLVGFLVVISMVSSTWLLEIEDDGRVYHDSGQSEGRLETRPISTEVNKQDPMDLT
jgi:hypothetical protein